MTRSSATIPLGLKIIGGFKLMLAMILLLAGVGVFHLRNADLGTLAQALLEYLHLDAQNRIINGMVESVTGLSHRKLLAIDAFTFVYAILYGIEGVGLLMRKHWAEYLVIIVTGLLIPYEIYETLFKFSILKAVVLAVNAAIMLYLMHALRSEKGRKPR